MSSVFEIIARRLDANHGPLGQRLRTSIASLIEDGSIQGGKPLPSERELAAELKVSRTTVRNCLKELAEMGLVRTRHGAGTIVTGRIPKALSQLSGFTEEIKMRGLTPTSKVINLEIGPIPRASAVRTGIPLDTQTMTLERLRMADGEVLSFERAIVPVACVGEDYDGTESLYERMDQNGSRPQRILQTLEAESVGSELGKLLNIPPTAAVLRVSQVGYGADGTAVEDATSWYRGDRYKYVGELRG